MSEEPLKKTSYETIPIFIFAVVIILCHPQLETFTEFLIGLEMGVMLGFIILFFSIAVSIYKFRPNIRIITYSISKRIKKLCEENIRRAIVHLLWFDLTHEKIPNIIQSIERRKAELIDEIHDFSETKFHRTQSLSISFFSWMIACITFLVLILYSELDYHLSTILSSLLGVVFVYFLSYVWASKDKEFLEKHLARATLTLLRNELGDEPAEARWGNLASEFRTLVHRSNITHSESFLNSYRRFLKSFQDSNKPEVVKRTLNGLVNHWLEEFVEKGQICETSKLREIIPVLEPMAQDNKLTELLSTFRHEKTLNEPLTFYKLTPSLDDSLQDKLANNAFEVLDVKRLTALVDLKIKWVSSGWSLRPSWSHLLVMIVDTCQVKDAKAMDILYESLGHSGSAQFKGVGSRVTELFLKLSKDKLLEIGINQEGIIKTLVHMVSGEGLKTLARNANVEILSYLVVEIGIRKQRKPDDESTSEAHKIASTRVSSEETIL